MLYELHGQILPFCKKYDNYSCTRIEKTEDDVIVAICTPSKVRQNNNEENEQKDDSPVLPNIIQPMNMDPYQTHILPDIYSTQTEIRTVTQTEIRPQALAQCAEGLKSIFDDLLSKVERNPAVFLKPVEEFIKNYQSLNKDNDIVNALQTFAQYTDVALAIERGIKREPTEDPASMEPTIVLAKKRKAARRRLITAKVQPPTSSQNCVSNQIDASQSHQDITQHQLPQPDQKMMETVVSPREVQLPKVSQESQQDIMNVTEISARDLPTHKILSLSPDLSGHHVLPHHKIMQGHEMVHQVSAHGMLSHKVLTHEMSIHGNTTHKAHEFSAPGITPHRMPISVHGIPTHKAHELSSTAQEIVPHKMQVHDGMTVHGMTPHKLSVHTRSPHKVPLHEATTHKVSVLEVPAPQVSMW